MVRTMLAPASSTGRGPALAVVLSLLAHGALAALVWGLLPAPVVASAPPTIVRVVHAPPVPLEAKPTVARSEPAPAPSPQRLAEPRPRRPRAARKVTPEAPARPAPTTPAPAAAETAEPSTLPSAGPAAPSGQPMFSFEQDVGGSSTGSHTGGTGGRGGSTGAGPAATGAPRGTGDGDAAITVRARPLNGDRIEPRYPPAAERLGLRGRVDLLLRVDREGRVVRAQVVRGAGEDFDREALAFSRRLRFAPARAGARVVASDVPWTVHFRGTR